MPENPLKSDEKLSRLLADVTSIKCSADLTKWKASFLKTYETYLDPDGVLNARDADGRLIQKLQSLAKVSLNIQTLAGQGHITQEQVTAEGRRGLSKWTEQMKLVEMDVAKFCPKTSADEDKVGYDKYELGAILIQDGFQAYEIMLTNRDFIVELRDGPLEGLLDKNALSIINFYAREMQAFVDIMSDLGLWKLMKQCVDVYKEEERPDPADEPQLFDEPTDEDHEEVGTDHGRGPDGKNVLTGGGAGKKPTKGSNGMRNQYENRNSKSKVDEYFDYKEKEEMEEEEPPPPNEGEGGEAQKIIYFDPKTGMIGLLEAEKCAEESELLYSKDGAGEPKNNGIIESKKEKENIVWLLKRVEKKEKPKEGAWLEEIKKEKAARKGGASKSSVRVTKDSPGGRPKAKKSAPGYKNPLEMGSSDGKRSSKAPARKSSKSSDGFSNPLEAEPSGGKGRRQRKSVADYGGIYQKAAPKPEQGGWEKVKAEEEQNQDAK